MTEELFFIYQFLILISFNSLDLKKKGTFIDSEKTYKDIVFSKKCKIRELVDRHQSTWTILD